MGKVVKGVVIGVIVGVVLFYTGGGGAGPLAGLGIYGVAGAAIAGGVLGGLSVLLAPSGDISTVINRGSVSVNPESPMVWAFGKTAYAQDAVWAGLHGLGSIYYSYVIANAAHEVYSYSGSIIINGEEVSFDMTDGLQGVSPAEGDWEGAVWREVCLGGMAGKRLLDMDADDDWEFKWPVTAYGKGIAYSRLRWATEHEKLNGSIPTRITQVGSAGLVYDPRLDTTVGGSGTHRADDQTTWEFYNTDSDPIGRNWALIVLRYLLGWKVNGVDVSIGMGIPISDIDIDQVMAAANVCEEVKDSVWRYGIDGVLPVTNDHEATIIELEAAINGKVSIVGGKYYIWAPNNDLTPFEAIEEEHILREAGVLFKPSGPMEMLYNTARGRYVDATVQGNYQMSPYTEMQDPIALAEDSDVRLIELDYPLIQSQAQAQRIATQYIRRSRFGATWKIACGPIALRFQPYTVTLLRCQETNNEYEYVRIISMDFSVEGVVTLELIEEDASIYDTSLPLGTSMTRLPFDGWDSTLPILLTGLTVSQITIIGTLGTKTDAFLVEWDDPGAFVAKTHVQFKKVTDLTWINLPDVHTDFLSAVIYPLEPGTTYDIRARHITVAGVAGPFVATTALAGHETTLGGDTLFNSDAWTTPITNPMGGWDLVGGSIANCSMQFSTIGPFGNIPKVLRIVGDGAASGVYAAWSHNFGVDDDTSYIIFCWVRNLSLNTDKGLFIQINGTVQLLSTYTDTTAGIMCSDEAPDLQTGEWYLAVTILHNSHYTGVDTGQAGLWDPATGGKEVDGAEFRNKAGNTSLGWSFEFYSNTTAFTTADGWEFTRPMAYKIDGSEPTIETALNLASVSGQSIIVANAYLRKSTTPVKPPDNAGSYDFSGRILTPPSTTTTPSAVDDWSTVPPSGTDPLYVISGTFETDGTTGEDESVVWSTPANLVSDGIDGDAIAVINAYLRKATAPVKPPDDAGSFNFATLVLTPPSTTTTPAAVDDWSATIPTGSGDPLYVTSGSFANTGGAGTDDTVVWSAPTILASDGVDAVKFYIKPTDGTAIHNHANTLTIEGHRIDGDGDALLATPSTYKLYTGVPPSTVVGDGYTATLDSDDINGDMVVELKAGPSATILDTITLVDIMDGIDGIDGDDGADADSPFHGNYTNQAHVVQVDASLVEDWTGSGGVLYIYEGNSILTLDSDTQLATFPAAGRYRVDIVPSTGNTLTEPAITGANTTTCTLGAWAGDLLVGTVYRMTIRATGTDGIATATIPLDITLSPAFAGTDGDDGAPGTPGTDAQDGIAATHSNVAVPIPIDNDGILDWTGSGGLFTVDEGLLPIDLASNSKIASYPGTVGLYNLFITWISGDTLTIPAHTGVGTPTATIQDWAGTLTQATVYRHTAWVKSIDGTNVQRNVDVTFSPVVSGDDGLPGTPGVDGDDGENAVSMHHSNVALAINIAADGTHDWSTSYAEVNCYQSDFTLSLQSNTQRTDNPTITGMYYLDITHLTGDTLTEPTITGAIGDPAVLGVWDGVLTQATMYRISARIKNLQNEFVNRVIDVTINPVFDGAGAVSVNYTNSAVPVPVTQLGVEDWTGTGGLLNVWDGTTALEMDQNGQVGSYPTNAGEFNVSIARITGDTLTEPTPSGAGTTTCTIPNWASNLTQVTVYRLQIYAKNVAGNNVFIRKDITISPVFEGTDGADGIDAVFGYIEPDGALASTRAINSGAWSPTQTWVDLDVTFVLAGASVGRESVRVTRTDTTGLLTASAQTHPLGDLNTTRISEAYIGLGTQSLTVEYTYDNAGYKSVVAETVITSLGGSDGSTITVTVNPTTNRKVPVDADGTGYDTYTSGNVYVTECDTAFEIWDGGVKQSGTNMFAMTDASSGTIVSDYYVTTTGNLVVSIDRTTGAILGRVTSIPYDEAWDSDYEWVEVTGTYDGVTYTKKITFEKVYPGGVGGEPDVTLLGGYYNAPAEDATATQRWGIKSNGEEWEDTNLGTDNDLGDWLISGLNTSYSIKITHVAGDFITYSAGGYTYNIWYGCETATIDWGIHLATDGVLQTTFKAQIRLDSSGAILAEELVTLRVFRTST